MILLFVYIALCVVAETAITIVGMSLESTYPTIVLPVYLTAFFVVLGVAWPLAIRLTAGWDKEAENSNGSVR
jgi:hypothetical protein